MHRISTLIGIVASSGSMIDTIHLMEKQRLCHPGISDNHKLFGQRQREKAKEASKFLPCVRSCGSCHTTFGDITHLSRTI